MISLQTIFATADMLRTIKKEDLTVSNAKKIVIQQVKKQLHDHDLIDESTGGVGRDVAVSHIPSYNPVKQNKPVFSPPAGAKRRSLRRFYTVPSDVVLPDVLNKKADVIPPILSKKNLKNVSKLPKLYKTRLNRTETEETQYSEQPMNVEDSDDDDYEEALEEEEEEEEAKPNFLNKFLEDFVYFEKPRGMIVFDWDDTICPTFHINKKGFNSSETNSCLNSFLSAEFRISLKRLDKAVTKNLEKALELTKYVYVVSNGDYEWIKESARVMLPLTYKLLFVHKRIQVISSRNSFEKIIE